MLMYYLAWVNLYKSIGVWSGDIDLNDGRIKLMHDAYLKRLEFAKHIGLSCSLERSKEHLMHLESEIEEDLAFLSSGIIQMY